MAAIVGENFYIDDALDSVPGQADVARRLRKKDVHCYARPRTCPQRTVGVATQ